MHITIDRFAAAHRIASIVDFSMKRRCRNEPKQHAVKSAARSTFVA
jgi:hypothetical protein